MSLGGKPKGAEFGAGGLVGGKVGVECAKKRFDVPTNKSGGMAAMLLHAAHNATRQMPQAPEPKFQTHSMPPVPVWATGLAEIGPGRLDLRIVVGATDIGFELTTEQAERLGRALMAASAPKDRPQ